MQPFGKYSWVLGLETVLCLAILQPTTAKLNSEQWITLFNYFLKRNFLTPFITQQIVPALPLSWRHWECNRKQTCLLPSGKQTHHTYYTTCAKTTKDSKTWGLRWGGSSRQLWKTSLCGSSCLKAKIATSKRIQVDVCVGGGAYKVLVVRKRHGTWAKSGGYRNQTPSSLSWT